MKFLRTALLIVFIFSGISFTQTINKNLEYINNEFRLYNSYNTSFSVDESTTLLFFYDDFGTYSIYFDNATFSIDKGILEIKCTDGEKCIYQVKKETFEGVYWDEYSMGLDGGNLTEVLSKLNDLKSLILGENTYSSDNTTSSNLYDTDLKYINDQFSLYNSYHTVFSVYPDSKQLAFSDDFGGYACYFAEVEIKESNDLLEIRCANGSKCILQVKDDLSMVDWDYYSMGLDGGNISEVVNRFNKIKNIVLNNESPSPNESGSTSNKAGASR
jgi:hypothetical protein